MEPLHFRHGLLFEWQRKLLKIKWIIKLTIVDLLILQIWNQF